MGQKSLLRTHFEPRVTVTTPANDDRQAVDFTGYFEISDVVDVIDVDPAGNILSVLAENLSVLAIDTDVAVTLSAVVDTTLATGTPMIRVQQIDDGHSAMDRLYRKPRTAEAKLVRKENILAQELNQPAAGKTLYRVANTKFIKAGDKFDILATEGLVASDVIVDSVGVQADALNNRSYVAITTLVDTSGFTNPFLLAKDITLQDAIERNQEAIDGIDSPVENEAMEVLNGACDRLHTVFETSQLFVAGSSKLFLDDGRKRKGTAGTRASLTQGAGNAQLIFTSMLLGLLGNEVEVQVQAGAGLGVTVTRTFGKSSSQIVPGTTLYRVVVNDNGGAATAADIAGAINGHAVAKRIVQAQYGGDGSGVVATFGPTALAGGLNDGTGDYAELEQVYRNNIVNTGYKFVSFHIRPNEENRMAHPPEQDEELTVDYRKATANIDY